MQVRHPLRTEELGEGRDPLPSPHSGLMEQKQLEGGFGRPGAGGALRTEWGSGSAINPLATFEAFFHGTHLC